MYMMEKRPTARPGLEEPPVGREGPGFTPQLMFHQ